ncbi:MAG TPA: ergothioneine biosynthesis protein EgtB [Acidimicrobiales bacterium]|nr:ergothioneine biosynthesis protein EgtB [Acidimicrobiales bacterium]
MPISLVAPFHPRAPGFWTAPTLPAPNLRPHPVPSRRQGGCRFGCGAVRVTWLTTSDAVEARQSGPGPYRKERIIELSTALDQETLAARFGEARALTEALAEPLSAEDQTVQSMPDVSPTKWHRAHTSWFFETFLLAPRLVDYRPFHPAYGFLFNSYYEGVGARHARDQRGLLSRPGIDDIASYRRHVNAAMDRLFHDALDHDGLALVELGINHEQQHQELLLMDIKHVLSCNPLDPAYGDLAVPAPSETPPLSWTRHPSGTMEIGHDGNAFSFDNESPRHRVYVRPFAMGRRPVTCGEWLSFIDDGGYHHSDLWLSDGWAAAIAEQWDSPLYWSRVDDEWHIFTLAGSRPLNPAEPVCHLSYYEADAYARWAGARLPTEAEWEIHAATEAAEGNFLDPYVLHPSPVAGDRSSPFGDVWQWTSSAYSPYPGFEPARGAVGEYNGKFMVSQYVLRGGCCATPPGHVRPTYRNFFPPAARWAFSGLRLAKDV